MSQTHPGLVNPKHVSETMSNQSPSFPSSGFPGRGQAASFLGRMPRLSTRANLIAFVVIGFFGTIALGFASIGRYVHFGYWRLVWVAAWCVIGLVAAIACAVLFAFLRRRKRRAEAEGRTSSGTLYTVVSIAVGVIGTVVIVVSGVYGIAVIRDFAEGPHTMKVTSCQLTQKAHYKPSDNHSKIIDYYDNHFTMTLEDGTTRTLTLETESSDDLAKHGGVSQTIYETCEARSGATSLTVDVYSHSWIIVDARVK